jgi:hypothetical protein
MQSMSKNTKPLAIFRPGRHVSNAGIELEFTEADVAAMAAAYNPTLHNAPLVIGHPKTNAPAYGWTQSIAFVDGLLKALPQAVSEQFAEWVNAGYYKKISASFYPPNSPSNPVPGAYYLRHIGFLGGHPPAVKGLPEPEFCDGSADSVMVAFAADDDFITLDFEEENPAMSDLDKERERLAAEKAALDKKAAELDAKAAEFAERDARLLADASQLAAEKQAAAKRGITEFAEGLVKSGQLLPKDKAGMVEFTAHLSDAVDIEFGEGDSKTQMKPMDWFKGFLQSLPKQVEFNEIAGIDPTAKLDKTDPQAIAKAAQAYQFSESQQGRDISAADAVAFVTRSN